MQRFLVVVLSLGLFIVGWFASSAVGQNNVLTGNFYQQLSQGSRVMYINGFADGLFLALPGPIVNGERVVLRPGVAERLSECLSPMTIGQIQAITERFLADHPNLWHWGMGVLTMAAIQDACSPRENSNP